MKSVTASVWGTPWSKRDFIHSDQSSNMYESESKCDVAKVLAVTDFNGLYRTPDKSKTEGYLIVSVQDCQTYGGGESVSIFSLDDGHKISFTGQPYTGQHIREGRRDAKYIYFGNAEGRLRGVYGLKNPEVIVDFGGSSTESLEGSASFTAHFDLQTGRLLKTYFYR